MTIYAIRMAAATVWRSSAAAGLDGGYAHGARHEPLLEISSFSHAKLVKVWIYFQVSLVASFGQSLVPGSRRITVGTTLGGILLVAGIVERWLVPVGGRAPGCGRACPRGVAWTTLSFFS